MVQKLMDGLLAKELSHGRFSIRDGGQTIYYEHTFVDPEADPDPMFSEQINLPVYGRSWQIDMRSDLAFRRDNSQLKPWLILVAGPVIEALIVTMLVMMSHAHGRAVAYADTVTQQLNEKIAPACKNQRGAVAEE